MNAKTVSVLIAVAAVLAVTGTSSPKLAFAPTCSSCAKAFAPGQLAINSGLPAHTFAPGQESHIGKCSSPPSYPPNPCAPGIVKKIPIGPGP